MPDLLWLDDQMDSLTAYRTAIIAAGFNVVSATKVDEAVAEMRKRRFDVIMTDLKMPPPAGLDFLRVAQVEQPSARYASFSSFLYLPHYREALCQLKMPILPIEKVAFPPDSQEFDEFVMSPLRALAEGKAFESLAEQDAAANKLQTEGDPFEVPLNTYLRLPMVKKDALMERAGTLARKTILKFFDDGYVWVLLCGSKENVCAKATNRNAILADAKIMQFATDNDRAPFHFFSATMPEDYSGIGGWRDCGRKYSLAEYPTVTLHIHGQKVHVHFDTGSPENYVSYEELRERDLVPPDVTFGLVVTRVGFGAYKCAVLNMKVLLECQGSGQKKAIDLLTTVVRDWDRSPYVRFCSDVCEIGEEEERLEQRRMCPNRTFGLMGRPLITNAGISLVLDGKHMKTRIEREVPATITQHEEMRSHK